MFGLRKNEDVSFFVEATLIQVCVGQNEVNLIFDNDAHITVESDFSVAMDSFSSELFDDCVKGGRALLQLLGCVVCTSEVSPSQGLVLSFKPRGRLEILDSNERYESFVVAYQDKRIVV
jgi:hypothetical protein